MNYLDKFENWMLEKGKKGKYTKIHSDPMSKASVQSRMTMVRTVLVNLGYVKREHYKIETKNNGTRGNPFGNPHLKFNYLVHSETHPDIKQINKLSIPELEKYFSEQFLNPDDYKEQRRKNCYVFAIWKLGEYFTYTGYWTPNKLEKLKRKVRATSPEDREIETLPPSKVDQFLEYLKDQNYKLYAMLYISRWIGGMRYGAVIRIKKNFQGHGGESGTFVYDMKSEKAKVYGKGGGGWNKARKKGCKIAPHVREKLKEILEWREQQNDESDWLFVSRYGKKYTNNDGSVNRCFKNYAKKSGLFKDDEIQYFKFHTLGRHGFGTWFYGKIPDKDLQMEMGHNDIKTTLQYAQIQHDEKSYETFVQAAEQGNGNSKPEPKKGTNSNNDKIGMIKELFGELSKKDKVKFISEIIT